VADASLNAQFPWLASKTRQLGLVSASMSFLRSIRRDPKGGKGGRASRESMLRASENLLKVLFEIESVSASLDRTELKRLEGQVENGEIASEEESTASGSYPQDSITFDLTSDLPEIEAAYDIVDASLPQKAFIVFDSIDALGEKYGIPKARLINTIQKDMVENGKANVLYVLESYGSNPLDYLGDGVISLATGDYKGRRIRLMSIEKMRGSPVPYPYLNYTLLDGRIRILDVQQFHRAKASVAPAQWSAIADLSGGEVSTGSPMLDKMVNGFAPGSVNLIEVGLNVPTEVTELVVSMLVSNFAAQGRGVAYLPSHGGDSNSARDMLSHYIDDQTFLARVKVFEMNVVGSERRLGNVMLLEGSKIETDLRWDNIEYNLSDSKGPLLSLISIDMLETIYGREALDSLSDHIYSLRKANGIFVGLLTEGKPLPAIAAAASVHLKIDRVGTTVVVYAEKPYTMLHAALLNESGSCPTLTYVPIM
jgi:hypothetical protein